jgi:hypothetical protein
LESADSTRHKVAIERANAWLAAQRPANVPDAAAAVLSRRGDGGFLENAQNSDGGWGPWKHSPSEAFDTAIAMIALKSASLAPERLRHGRDFLLRSQLPTGGWPETTRPAGGQSYAQHISTTAWATIALLRTSTQ